ncbi:5-hydroxytryptamine receptor 1-like [Anneissia japonica]|uniref:5-hydroxytryptamine receptor 1-like n=1 Tax=Anneissia japonica TaxID=1529436 RepID=UPI00142576E0|nr:5-hydroxytryptamine receptor 1-like [Anneissia japonica]
MNETQQMGSWHNHPAILSTRYIIGIVGILANLLVVVVFNLKKIHKKSSTHLLIYHQSWVDMSGCLAFVIYYTVDPPDGEGGDVFCKTRAIFWHLLYVSTNNLVLVTIERYVAVLHSNWYRVKFSRRRRKEIVLFLPHVIALIMSAYLVVAAQVDDERPWLCEYNVSNESLQILSGVIVFLICFLIPTTIMIFCYARIFKAIRSRAQGNTAQSLPHRPSVSNSSQSSRMSSGLSSSTASSGVSSAGTMSSGVSASGTMSSGTYTSTTCGGLSSSRMSTRRPSDFNSGNPRSRLYTTAQKNLIITLFCVFISFLICITPNFTLYLVHAICNCFHYHSYPLHEITVTLLAVNLCVNPFIYAFKFNDFKHGFTLPFQTYVEQRSVVLRRTLRSHHETYEVARNRPNSVIQENGQVEVTEFQRCGHVTDLK